MEHCSHLSYSRIKDLAEDTVFIFGNSIRGVIWYENERAIAQCCSFGRSRFGVSFS